MRDLIYNLTIIGVKLFNRIHVQLIYDICRQMVTRLRVLVFIYYLLIAALPQQRQGLTISPFVHRYTSTFGNIS